MFRLEAVMANWIMEKKESSIDKLNNLRYLKQ